MLSSVSNAPCRKTKKKMRLKVVHSVMEAARRDMSGIHRLNHSTRASIADGQK